MPSCAPWDWLSAHDPPPNLSVLDKMLPGDLEMKMQPSPPGSREWGCQPDPGPHHRPNPRPSWQDGVLTTGAGRLTCTMTGAPSLTFYHNLLSQETSYSPWHLIVAVIQAVIMMGCHSLHMYELGLSCSCCHFIWFMSPIGTTCVVIPSVLEESILWFDIKEKVLVNTECQGHNRGINLILVR